MKGTHLGEFEELVLLTVGILQGNAYGITVLDQIEEHTDRRVSISTIHSTLNRLEKKGFIESYVGGASATRGGRSKRLYKINEQVHSKKCLIHLGIPPAKRKTLESTPQKSAFPCLREYPNGSSTF